MNWVGQSSYLGEEIESQKIKNWGGDHDRLLNFGVVAYVPRRIMNQWKQLHG